MNYNIVVHDNFKRELKPFIKKYPSIKSDLEDLINNISTELSNADDLGNGFKKIRLNIKSKGKGKSGGARIISFETVISIDETTVLFGSIYNKTDFTSINLDVLKKNLGV